VTCICFSATSSFIASVALLGIGAVTIRQTTASAERPYAAIPLIFGVQQLVEGILWLELPAQSQATHMLAIAYMLFSHILWPIYVPLAVLAIEPLAVRRRLIVLPTIAGAGAGLFFLIALATSRVSATIAGPHIAYHLPHPHDGIALTLYVAGTCLAPLLSSYRTVQLFGVAIACSMLATYLAYAMWFASVWCFFAALTSGVVFVHFSRRGHALT